jgi:hypothetical protein
LVDGSLHGLLGHRVRVGQCGDRGQALAGGPLTSADPLSQRCRDLSVRMLGGAGIDARDDVHGA